jgi:hypothetical protein
MRLQFTQPVLVASSMILLIAATGCRLGMKNGDSVWNRPALGSLAFWKKEEKSVPKPPAVHFDPTPAQTDVALADQGHKPTNTRTDLQDSLEKLGRYEANPKETPVDELAEMAENLNQPIRTPYQLSEGAAESNFNNPSPSLGKTAGSPANNNDFEFNPPPLKLPERNANAFENPSADQARSQFLADMRGVQAVDSAPPQQNTPLGGSPHVFQPLTNNVAVGSALSMPPIQPHHLQEEVARAQREIAELKAQLANNQNRLVPINGVSPGQTLEEGRKDSGTFMPQEPPQNGSTSLVPGSSPGFQAAGSSGTGGFAPLKPNSNFEPLRESPGSTPYPATSHGDFSTARVEDIRMAQQYNDRTVRPVGLNASAGSSNFGRTDEIQPRNIVSDVAIPDSILKGKGTFAPGSVNRLRNQY